MTTERNHLALLRLDAVRSGEGTAAERLHVDGCEACRAEVERMEEDVHGIEAAMPASPELSKGDRESILASLRRERSRRSFPLPRPRHIMPLAAAAAALAAFLLLFPGSESEVVEPVGNSAVSGVPAGRPTLDVNGDGFLDSGDVDELARIIRGGTGSKDRWDFNGDGKADGADVDYLSREIGTDSGDYGIEFKAGC